MSDSTKKCPRCGGVLQENASFCLYCMEPLAEKTVIEKPGKNNSGKKKAALAASLALVAVAAAILVFVYLRSDRTASPAKDEEQTNGSVEESDSTGTRAGTDTDGEKAENDPASSERSSLLSWIKTVKNPDDKEDGKTDKETSAQTADGKKDNDANAAEPSAGDKQTATSTQKNTGDSSQTKQENKGDSGAASSAGSSASSATSASSASSGTASSASGGKDNSGSGKTPQITPTPSNSTEEKHVHTDSCYKYVVDKPYKAAVYENVKVVDVPYKEAEYGYYDVQYTEEKFTLSFYTVSGSETRDNMYFSSRADFEAWIAATGARKDAAWSDDGRVTLDGVNWFFNTKKSSYTATRQEYGLITPEQPEESHVERREVSPEQPEEGHYELICGY